MSRSGVTGERLVALFLLGLVLFTPPFLAIFDRPERVLGIPSLYLYLFAAWTALIALMVLVIESPEAPEDTEVPRAEPARHERED